MTRRSATGIGAAILGLAIIGGADLIAGADRWFGDLLALIGAMAMACYLLLATELRRSLTTTQVVTPAYGIAALALFGFAVASGDELVGHNTATWLAIFGMVIGPQLLGHTMLSRLVATLGPVTVSLALVTEPIGATVLAWLLLDEAPPATIWVGMPLVIAGLWLHLADRASNAPKSPADPDTVDKAHAAEHRE